MSVHNGFICRYFFPKILTSKEMVFIRNVGTQKLSYFKRKTSSAVA